MRLLFITACLLSAAIGSANAQQSRERLDGFGGVRFGATFEEAKRILGPGAKEEKGDGPPSKNGIERHLRTELPFAGELHNASFTFGAAAGLIRIGTGPKQSAADRAACIDRNRVQQFLERQYGPAKGGPKSENVHEYVFNFKDGNHITHMMMWIGTSCLDVTYFSMPEVKVR